jgi:hypothetical protein
LFRPVFVKNPQDSSAAVHGTFVFQRRGPDDEWADENALPLSTLKKDQWTKLDLHAVEVLKLYRELGELYRVYARNGIPAVTKELVSIDSIVTTLAGLPPHDLKTYLSAHNTVGAELLSNLLSWVVQLKDSAALVSRLTSLGPDVLRNLSAAIGLGSLKDALKTWTENEGSSSEEFWQQTLATHSFVLAQVFSWPVTVVKGKAYVGGKSIMNTGGGIVDFLVKNSLTNNAALVEIKTPSTPLLSGQYRAGVYGPSVDLAGSMTQVLDYRSSLQREFQALRERLHEGLESFEPECVVLIGRASEVQGDPEKLKSFELFRSNSSKVAILTFDELFERTRRLVNVLQSSAELSETNREVAGDAGT